MMTFERTTAHDYELSAQMQELLAGWAPSAESDCLMCRHLATSGGITCAAFPDGVPWEIQSGEFDHRLAHPRDRGIQYDPLMPEDFAARAAKLRAQGRPLAQSANADSAERPAS